MGTLLLTKIRLEITPAIIAIFSGFIMTPPDKYPLKILRCNGHQYRLRSEEMHLSKVRFGVGFGGNSVGGAWPTVGLLLRTEDKTTSPHGDLHGRFEMPKLFLSWS